ncbi:MAG: hypothetical protein ABL962_14320 [Fimbriimonadaceae bacterium]
MASTKLEIVKECKRQVENCLYTSTAMMIWLRWLRYMRGGLIALGVTCGALAGWNLLSRSNDDDVQAFSGVLAIISAVIPAAFAALRLDERVETCRKLAGEFKNLQDRFRQVACIDSKADEVGLRHRFNEAMWRIDRARQEVYTPPEWCFVDARRKIVAGDYTFDVDESPETPL